MAWEDSSPGLPLPKRLIFAGALVDGAVRPLPGSVGLVAPALHTVVASRGGGSPHRFALVRGLHASEMIALILECEAGYENAALK